ncbi:hypothetical protein A3F32_00060 [Candidatus Roizmanbacteria bacterium RIFCSPHIGHO2_12_FULL_42_10]|uniref:DNA-directed DNA polymerase n=3 Tax=Candidatus Roizmaniibacteriota TaxID=1752723 RepID=A0A1F7I451_9BACT|nr:MAG: hypothetical protein A3D08_02760 [Candidatus Roizmanbacteria bacterium RIFCSPHIGHO2_02_FULL_43_11]OGK38113.1 MAG: hypothetical protein A3F32_00060 [Candidatus Roizmanbacteria bacterium RIFCSPHIGHO2_12_FULL_42_10]
MHPTNKDIVILLKSVAAAYTLTGVNQFRIIAYQKAADAVEHLTQEIYDVWQNGHLDEIPGLGPIIRQHLDEYFTNPVGSYLEKQTQKIPAPVYKLMQSPGIGPKRAFRIVQEFKLDNPKTIFEDVKSLAAKNKIVELEGFGEKSQKEILKAINLYEERGQKEERMVLPVAGQMAEDIIMYMKQLPEVSEIQPLGSLRRKAPTIGDIDLVAVVEQRNAEKVINHFTAYSRAISVQGKGDVKASIMVTGGKRIDLDIIPRKRYGSMLQYFTGNKLHNIKLREYALRKGYSLNEFGIKEVKTGKMHTFETEEAFYEFLHVDWIPPEIREGGEEIKLALQHALPNLVEPKDMKGEFHVHSDFDIVPSHDIGMDSIEKMAKKAEELGYIYLALSEHNPAMSRVDESQAVDLIRRKAEAVAKIKTPVKLLNSLEIDIQPNGDLALAEDAFKYLDIAIVSIHSSFKMSRDDMTKRILKALAHPGVKILGHPTGRQIGKREEIEADWQTVFDFAKKHHIALEINAWHERLDLPEGLVRRAIQNGNKLVINTDAHAASQMDGLLYGVYVARRGWAEKSDIINTQPLDRVMSWIKGK